MNLETLETNRLLLKALTPADIKYIFENHSKPQIKSILCHRTEEEYLLEEYKYLNGYSSYKSRFITFF
jgi:hypothetical protein